MRALLFAAFVASATGQAAGQSAGPLPGPGTRLAVDTVGRFIRRPTAEEIRQLHAEVAALAAQVHAQQLLVRGSRDTARARGRDEYQAQVQAQAAFSRVVTALFPKQSQLTIACNTLRVVAGGREGYLGVTFGRPVRITSPEPGMQIVTTIDGPPRIDAVDIGSPADRAGVRPGDEWLAIAGRPVLDVPDEELDELIKPGVRVLLRLRNDGKEREATVTVAKRPEFPEKECESAGGFAIAAPLPEMWIARSGTPPGGRAVTASPQPPEASGGLRVFFETRIQIPLYGAVFKTIDPDAREVMNISVDGVLVEQVGEMSPAGVAGLRRFDVVTHVNGTAIKSPVQVLRISNESRTLTLTVVRSGETRTVTLARP